MRELGGDAFTRRRWCSQGSAQLRRPCIRTRPAILQQIVSRGALPSQLDIVEVDLRHEQLGLVPARRSGDGPAVGTDDDRSPEERGTPFDADAIGADHDDAVLRRRRHGDVVTLAVAAVVPHRALERGDPVGRHRDDLCAGDSKRSRRFREPQVEADDHAEAPEGKVDEGQLRARLEPGLLVVEEMQLAVGRQQPVGPDHDRAVVPAVAAALVYSRDHIAVVARAHVAETTDHRSGCRTLRTDVGFGLTLEHVAAGGELGEDNQLCPLGHGLVAPADGLGQVVVRVADPRFVLCRRDSDPPAHTFTVPQSASVHPPGTDLLPMVSRGTQSATPQRIS